ncbi:MAG TPA: ABC transporter permease [Gaiellaceae bacterium]|nr:ABC transporter permease [Gaiellaceae bacterium]
MIRVERRLEQPRWLNVAVPVGSVAVSFLVMAVVLAVTGHDPLHTYSKLFRAAYGDAPGWTATLMTGTPILFTGLAAAVAFRMQLFNIGAEGQLYLGALCGLGVAAWIGPHHGIVLTILTMCLCGAAGGALWALIPGVLRAFGRTNEIITTLMLNYVAGLLLTYLIFDSASPFRDVSTIQTRSFPQSKSLAPSQFWPSWNPADVVIPFGFMLGAAVAAGLFVLFRRTRFGFEMNVLGDSPRAARYAGIRTRRKILAVMGLSGAVAGLGGASQVGDFSHVLDASPEGLQGAAFGYTGIVVAALGRYNPFAVVLVAVLIGGLQNAGLYLQGPDFPTGLIGVLQGVVLFCTLGGELLVRYRVRLGRRPAAPAAAAAEAEA